MQCIIHPQKIVLPFQVIGKAGANIEQLQRSSAARIQLSRAGEFYPGV